MVNLTKEPQPQFLDLDADHQGYLLARLAEYHNYILQCCDDGTIRMRDGLDTLYLLGNMEGRLLHGHVMEQDVDLITEWISDMEDAG